MDTFWQDLQFGARVLRKRAGFTTLAVLALALGIGANTAIFSAVNGILIASLPLRHPDRLALFYDGSSEGISSGDPHDGVWERFSFDSYRFFAAHVGAFDGLAAFRNGTSRVSVVGAGGDTEGAALASAHLVTGDLFPVLEAEALLGRALAATDDADTAPAAAVISYGCWRRLFGGEASAVGRAVTLNGTPFTIVGVMPERFLDVHVRQAPDFWLPLRWQPQIDHAASMLERRDFYWLNMVGRMRAGTDLAKAQAAVDVAMRQYLREAAGDHPSSTWQKAIEHGSVRLVPGARGISGLRDYYGEALRVLLVVTAFVLLIACANIAGLLLSRAGERRSEIAMRLALGAGRWRLVRQLLTESLLLAGLGGGAGLVLALWGADALKTMVSARSPVPVGLSLPVLGYTALVSLLAGALCGVVPALGASRGDPAGALRARTAAGDGGTMWRRLAPALVVAQVALSLVLLSGAGLLARSLRNLSAAEVGFARDHVALVDIDTRISGLEPGELSGYYRRLVDRIQAVPGVEAATVAMFSPMSGSMRTSNISLEGFTPSPGTQTMVQVNQIGPRYTKVLGVPLVKGREFDERDAPGAPQVALVNQAFVRAFFPHGDPIGRRLGFGDDPAHQTIRIVGIVGDVRFEGPRDEPVRMVLVPLLQATDESAYASDLEVRTAGDPAAAMPALRRAVEEVDARVPIAGVATLERQVADSTSRERLFARLVGGFSLLALVLACVGLYGVVSQAVTRRTGEVGIRMALGAARRDILAMVLREVGTLVLLGVGLGLPGAAVAARLLGSQLYGVGPADPATLVLSALVLCAVAVAAGYLPARRAARLDPMVALRAE